MPNENEKNKPRERGPHKPNPELPDLDLPLADSLVNDPDPAGRQGREAGSNPDRGLDEENIFDPDLLAAHNLTLPSNISTGEPLAMAVAISKLNKDIKSASALMSRREASVLVDSYYSMQEQRIAMSNRFSALTGAKEPRAVIGWFVEQFKVLENQAKGALTVWVQGQRAGRWATSQVGIGPVITACLLATVDFEGRRTAGQVWSFCGLDPTSKWRSRDDSAALVKRISEEVGLAYENGDGDGDGDEFMEVCVAVAAELKKPLEWVMGRARVYKDGVPTETRNLTALAKGLARRPWSADMKQLIWNMGESFVKTATMKDPDDKEGKRRILRPDAFYGKMYYSRKAYEQAKNLNGDYRDQAIAILDSPGGRKMGKDTEPYKALAAGMLSKPHIHARCKRYACTRFLSHLHQVVWEANKGERPPVPFAIGMLGHADMIEPPGWPCE